MTNKKVNFGFKQVNFDEKPDLVRGIFSSVASNYDIMNDFMSGGVHRIWKNNFVSKIENKEECNLIDVAGGTGDISFRFIDAGGMHSTVCDLTASMVEEGRKRAINKGYFGKIDWKVGDALELPFEDNTFDTYTISFGIRNVVDIQKALEEARRVLKPGGKFLCLEFSHVTDEKIKRIYDLYSFKIIPTLGQLVAGDKDSYQYLVESIRMFPKQDTFKKMIEMAGFENCGYENQTFGVACIHWGYK